MVRCAKLLVATALLAAGLPCLAEPAMAAGSPSHAERGIKAGAEDFSTLAAYLCAPPPVRNQSSTAKAEPPRAIAPGQAFRNLYFVGHARASAWVIRTSAGLILVDALDNSGQAQDYIEGGMRALGLEPAQIKVMIITHFHYDHAGGAAYLARKYHPQVIMGAADWQSLAEAQNDLPEPARLVRGLAVTGSDAVTLGDTKVELFATPGHTEGTLSLVFPVQDSNRTRLAVLWGGTDIRTWPGVAPGIAFAAYARSAQSMRELVAKRGIDVFLSNHASADGTEAKLATLSNGAVPSNPFVSSIARTERAFEMFRECALARTQKPGKN